MLATINFYLVKAQSAQESSSAQSYKTLGVASDSIEFCRSLPTPAFISSFPILVKKLFALIVINHLCLV